MSVRSKKRALLLVNPKARRGGEALDAVIGRLHTGGLDVTVEPFSALPEIGRDIARLRETAELIILCGGDGSVASGATAVMESGLPLGIIPLGTANDLARTLGIPMDLTAAADVILAGNTRRIDLGENPREGRGDLGQDLPDRRRQRSPLWRRQCHRGKRRDR